MKLLQSDKSKKIIEEEDLNKVWSGKSGCCKAVESFGSRKK
jgi:hypothetical protein